MVNSINGLDEELDGLNDSLKNLTKIIKSLNDEGKGLSNIGKELSRWDNVTKKLIETTQGLRTVYNQNREDIRNNVNGAQELKQVIDKIDAGSRARFKLGEEENKLSALKAKLAANITGITQQQVNNQQQLVDNLSNQLTEYKEILTGQDSTVKHLSDENKERLKNFILLKAQQEQGKIYRKNHEDIVNLIKSITDEDERNAALKAFKNQLAQEELNKSKEQVEAILKISYIAKTLNKTKSFFIDLLGLEKLSLLNIIKGSFELNKIYTDSAKQLGISASNAREIASAYTTIAPTANTVAAAGNNLLQTRKNELEAMGQINSALGTAANISGNRVQDQVALVKNMGLEADTATKITFLSLVSGKNNKEILDTVNNQVISLGKQTGIYLDNRKILSDVAKVEGQLAAQYQNNPELLAKAVIQVKQLGIELSQAANMSNKLLNFQSSIQSELEAELLIGKALNFERARELALRGDSAAAAKEMLDQVGGLTEFQNLNVIQQRSLAESMGMSADELANSLKTQDLLLKTGDKSIDALNERRRLAIETGKTEEFYAELKRAGTSEEMIANQMQLGNQDKMNILVDKMLETFSNMVEPLTNIVGSFSNLVSSAGAFKALAVTIASLWGARIAFSIASTVTSLRQANAALVIQRGIQNVLLEKKKKELVVTGATAAFSTGPGFPFAIAAVGAILAGLGIASSLGAFSSGGESINNPSAGASFNKSNNVSNPQNDRPIEFTVNLGGNTLAKVNTSNNKSQNTQMA
jgi:hypothetical protein